MDSLVDHNVFYTVSFTVRLGLLKLNVASVLQPDLLMNASTHLLRYLVAGQCDAHIVGCSLEHGGQRLFDIVVNLVHAEVEVLELGVFHLDPLLDYFAFWGLSCHLFDIV